MKQDPVNYWEQFERLERLIKASELKAGLIFSFHGLILGLFFDRVHTFQPILERSNFFAIAVGIWILFVLISIFFAVKCFIPRMELNYDTNVFFFGDAINEFENEKSFSEAFMKVCGDEEQLYEQLSEQIHVESKIINYKFRYVKRSIIFMSLSLMVALPIIILVLVNVF
ncbi:MAG: hypothetical protein HKN00_08955 [Flavobacteriaceae bacterium]|nr:hypothetical protein [Bacteroidia bacterium]NNF75298.1 hypothetical protein [Flavobacteriaceae bacterium]NNK72207.1 hypothetical protein [Flavobacteriaceae bacterium]